MRFRFTISRDVGTPEPLPDLTAWLSGSLGNVSAVVPWSNVGTSTPDLSINAQTSEFLYTDYVFQKGWTYKIDIALTMDDISMFPLNPRTLGIVVKDEDNVTIVSHGIPISPGSSVYSFTFTAKSDCRKFGFLFQSGSNRTLTVDAVDMEVTDFGLITAQISEPDGWKDCSLKLTRDPVFHSLNEHIEGSFIFYGDNGRVNGGYHILKQWEEDGGPDVDIDILIEYSDNDVDFYELFRGQLDMSESEWMPGHKVRVPIIKDNFWATFMNRKDTPVSLTDPLDLDGNEVVNPVPSMMLELPSQKIRYNGRYNWIDSVTYPGEAGLFALQLDWESIVTDDLKKFNLPRVAYDIGNIGGIANDLIGNFEAPWDGDYRIQCRLFFSEWVFPGNLWISNEGAFNLYVQKTNQTSMSDDLKATKTVVTIGSESYAVANLDVTIRLYKGEQVAIFAHRGNTSRNYTVFGERRLSWKTDVDVATTGTIALSGEQTIDGEMTSSSRVLVKNQGNAEQNGIYVSSAGAWTRATDSDTEDELYNSAVFVISGDTQAESAWRQTEDDFVLDIDPLRYVFLTPSDERFSAFPDTVSVENYLVITADTTFKTTQAEGFLLHDALAAIIQRLGLK